MFDKNYLGHHLSMWNGEQTFIGIVYICSKCNMFILYSIGGKYNSWHYKYKIEDIGWDQCKLSCNETIIKKLLE